MKCPLCENRKAKRFCPAKAVEICPVCCGTKREVEIDCPSNCVYLHEGREYESKRMVRKGPWVARTERLWQDAFINQHYQVFLSLWAIILDERHRFPELVDSDVQMTLDARDHMAARSAAEHMLREGARNVVRPWAASLHDRLRRRDGRSPLGRTPPPAERAAE